MVNDMFSSTPPPDWLRKIFWTGIYGVMLLALWKFAEIFVGIILWLHAHITNS